MIEDLERQSLASGKLSSWLDKNGLTDLKRFFEEIEVPPEWGTALEAVLREKAQAIAVSRLELASGFEALPPPARLTFYVSEKTSATAPEGSLLNLVQGQARTESVLAYWLAGVFVAEDIASARALLKTLPEGSLVVTKAGHLLEKDAVTFWSTSQETGNLKRRAQIKALREKEKATADEMKAAREALDAAQRAKNQEEGKLFEAKRALTQYESEAQRLTREVTQLEADIRIYETRKGDIEKRLADARERATSAQTALAALEKTFDAADAKVLAAQEKVSDAEGAFEKSRQALTHAERHVESVRFAIREKENRLNVARERSAEADRSREMSLVRIGDFQNQLQTINDALAAVTQEDTAQETEALTKKRNVALIAKEAAAQGVTDIQNAAQTQTEQTKALASQKEAAQNALATIVADRQRFEIDFATATSRLPESADLTALRETFESERPKLTSLKARVEALSREAASLGAVNHAALEELTTQKALVENVNAQIADLEKALETITSAITKIDAQTRAVLRQTFDRVNTAFGTLFAELFKGGEAYLKFTDDDVLSAGVEMFASPPGKRLKSIMQLSGGELTLTATALVFAFFTLNPAPFCLLDEADAPLDEANQERLAGLIEKMSANTQFMMITHHRVSMSHMAQLIGVTMREAGVSRVVSVDIAQADGFVEKGAS